MCGAESQSAKAYCKRCGEWVPDIKGRRGIAFGGETPQENLFTEIDAPRSTPALNSGDMTDFVTAPGTLQPPLSIAEPTTKNLDLANRETATCAE